MTGQDMESLGGVGEHMHSVSLSQGAHGEAFVIDDLTEHTEAC